DAAFANLAHAGRSAANNQRLGELRLVAIPAAVKISRDVDGRQRNIDTITATITAVIPAFRRFDRPALRSGGLTALPRQSRAPHVGRYARFPHTRPCLDRHSRRGVLRRRARTVVGAGLARNDSEKTPPRRCAQPATCTEAGDGKRVPYDSRIG